MKDGDVGADGEFEDQLAGMGSVVVILREAFADAGCNADDGVGVGVVAGGAAGKERSMPDAALLELSGGCRKDFSQRQATGEEGEVALLWRKAGGSKALELFADGCRVRDGDLLLQILHSDFRRLRHVGLAEMRLKSPRRASIDGQTPELPGEGFWRFGDCLQKWQRGAARSKPCRIS